MNKKKLTIIMCFVLWFSFLAYTHGLKLEVEKKSPCVLVTARYHGGAAIGDGEVKVFFNDVQQVFQEGKTDVHGKFSFIPDTAGTWYFQVDDGMGHRKRIKIAVGDDFFKQVATAAGQVAGDPGTAPGSETGHSHEKVEEGAKTGTGTTGGTTGDGSIYCKILLGLVLIFACTFVFYITKKKKENKEAAGTRGR